MNGKQLLLKVMVVEDAFIMRRTHRAAFEKMGMEVVEAMNGREALEKLGQTGPECFSLIMLDLMMPEMNGKEFVKAARKTFGNKLPPLLVCSSKADVPEIKELGSLGISGYMIKPVSYLALQQKVNGILGMSAGGSTSKK